MPATEAAVSDYERERGKPMPSRHHSLTESLLSASLWQGASPDYLIHSEMTLELDGKEVTPDLCVYPRTRVDYARDEVRVTEPPLVAVEIASPTQGTQGLLDKIQFMLDAGVQSCWLVQPALRTITVFGGDMQPETHDTGTVTDPATGLNVALDDVFLDDEP
jgi:Uma2 family endonuclease